MTVYVRWKKEIDTRFREIYRNVTLETIQDPPLENIEGTHFMIGSSVVTLNKVNRITQELAKEGLMDKVDFFMWKHPADWNERVPDPL